jgi:hypothetical protein
LNEYRNSNVNNKYVLNSNYFKQIKNPSTNCIINNSVNKNLVGKGIVDNMNKNALFYNNNIIHNVSINNVNDNNKNVIKNNNCQNNSFENTNYCNFYNYSNNIVNEDFNFNTNKNLLFNNEVFANDISSIYNIYNNNYNNYFTNNINNQIKLINFAKLDNNINENVNVNKMKSLNNNKKNSLTAVLCSKKGINDIRNLILKNPNDINLIRKIILILNEENGLHTVFKNIYGNYFIQELFQKMNKDLIQLTIDLINSEFVNIAKTPSGTHSLQSLLNYIDNSEMEISIIKAIKYKEKEMAFNEYATYVLQKIISIIPDNKRVRLNNIIIENAKELSLNANSVFVLKKFIMTNTIEENKRRLMNSIKKHFLIISQNPFGNYVIQYLLEVWTIKDCELIVNEIFNKVIELSSERFSANIIIYALKCFNNNYKKKLITILCFSVNIINLLKNKYSFYVINKTVNYMDKNTKTKFRLYLEKKSEKTSSKEMNLIKEIITLIDNEI